MKDLRIISWVDFYGNILDNIGCARRVRCDNHNLEIMPGMISGKPCLYLVNHSDMDQKALVEFCGKKKRLAIGGSESTMIKFNA